MNPTSFNRIKELMNKPLSRRGLVNVRRLAWGLKKSINTLEQDILRKHCGVNKKLNPQHPFLGYIGIVDPHTGELNLKYDPGFYDQDIYL